MSKSLKSMTSFLSKNSQSEPYRNDIVKEGILRKTKNMKKRYFVLRKQTSVDSPARLEYYENKKKFQSGGSPRRQYLLKDIYVSRKVDSKGKFCFAIFNKDSVNLIAETQEEMQSWMKELNFQKSICSGAKGFTEYSHTWRVEVQNRGVGSTNNLSGVRFVVLTKRSLGIFHYGNSIDNCEIGLNSIQRCDHTDQFFFIEIGRKSEVGSGILWMKTEDPLIAENMKSIVGDAISKFGKLGSANNNQSDVTEAGLPCNRWRVNSLTGPSKDSFLTGDTNSYAQPRNRTLSESGVSSRLGGHGSRSDAKDGYVSIGADANCDAYVPMEDYIDSSNSLQLRKLPSSSEGYVSMGGSTICDSPADNLQSPLDNRIREESSASIPIKQPGNAYLDMTKANFQSTSATSSIPIPIGGTRDSSYLEMSPQSESSTSTSRTTSSDQLHEGSVSTVGSGFNPEDILDRPIRTSSVGSKPEPYHIQKIDPIRTEPSRARAFTIGSYTHYNVTQPVTLAGKHPPLSCDTFPSIHEASSQNKCKSCSTPLLLCSPVSHSWSGPSGTYFRNHLKDTNKMVLDYSKSGSIGEEKDTKSLCGSLGIHRYRSNSKSSGSSNQRSSDFSDWTESEKGVDIPSRKKSDDYFQFSSSPRSEIMSGYLHMTGTKLTAPDNTERKHTSYVDLSTKEHSCDGYVDMSSNNNSMSLSQTSDSQDDKKDSKYPNNLSLDLQSPHADFMAIDVSVEDKFKNRKKGSRKANKRSLRDGSKSRKSDPGSFLSWSSEDNSECSKSKGPLSTITSLITRKSQNAKSPVSPQQSLLSKSFGNTSPFASLTRTKSKECKETHEVTSGSPKSDINDTEITDDRIPSLPFTPEESVSGTSSSVRPDMLKPTSDIFLSNENRDYVNMSLSPQSLTDRRVSTSIIVEPERNIQPPDDNYMVIDGSKNQLPKSTEKISKASTHITPERARSLSGPGKVKSVDKKLSDCRTLSACSSPVSSSPPMSPNLGSVSSMSSLSEGGLSSASSTSTVINVGVTRAANQPIASMQKQTKEVKTPNKCPTSDKEDAQTTTDSKLNYVSLDLRECPDGRPCARSDESSYTEIDFIKSEGLRNTALGRDSNRQ